MILSDGQIKEHLECGELEISGWDGLFIGPSSVDLHMGAKCKVLNRGDDVIELDTTNMDKLFTEFDTSVYKGVTISPGEFYLMSTIEKVKLSPGIAGFVHGRSSLARLGIKVHDAGFIDPGFEGTITLEVTNLTHTSIFIPKFTRICQIVFIKTGHDAEVPYGSRLGSKYQGQNGPTITRINKDYY